MGANSFFFYRSITAGALIGTEDEVLRRLHDRWKSPLAWSSDFYEALEEEEQDDRFANKPCIWCRRLTRWPRDGRADEGGLESLFRRGFSGALHLGAIDAWTNRQDLQLFYRISVYLQISLINDGELPWKPGAKLCNFQGNSSQNISWTCKTFEGESESCPAVPVGGLVQLMIKIPLYPIPDPNKVGWYQTKFSLCDATTNQPFGILMDFLTSFGGRSKGRQNQFRLV